LEGKTLIEAQGVTFGVSPLDFGAEAGAGGWANANDDKNKTSNIKEIILNIIIFELILIISDSILNQTFDAI